MSDDTLLKRLWEAAIPFTLESEGSYFTPEAVARGLEAALNKAGELTAGPLSFAWAHGMKLPEDAYQQCIDAFLSGLSGSGAEESRDE